MDGLPPTTRGLGVLDSSWSVAADVAFLCDPEYSLTSENDDKVSFVVSRLEAGRSNGAGVVALGPSSLVLGKSTMEGIDYTELLHGLIRGLHELKLHVLLTSNATREGSDALRNNDIADITQLQARLRAAPEGVDDESITYMDFDVNTGSIRALAGCELVITSRFHAMVAALALGIPIIVMGWSHKYEDVLEAFDCAENAVNFSEAQQKLLPMVERLLDERDATARRISRALPSVMASSERQFELVDQLPMR